MAGSFSITLDEFKGGFVNRRVLLDMVRMRKRALLQAHGEEIRYVAGRTLRSAKKLSVDKALRKQLGLSLDGPLYKPNPAPLFPNVRLKKKDPSPKNISKPLYALDSQTDPNKVIAGPPRLGANPVPALLERGYTRQTSSRRRVRKLGGGGEIRIDRGVVSKRGRVRFGKRSKSMVDTIPDRGGMVRVVYTKLRTQAQVARAQAINDSLYKPSRPVRVQGRRYMQRIANMVIGSKRVADTANRLFRSDTKSLPKVRGVGLRLPSAPRRIAA